MKCFPINKGYLLRFWEYNLLSGIQTQTPLGELFINSYDDGVFLYQEIPDELFGFVTHKVG